MKLLFKKKKIKDFEHFRFLELARINEQTFNDWALDLDYAKVRAELVFLEKRKFSRNFIKIFKDIQDTILHEIAHALVGPKHGHNKVWKEMAPN